MTRILILLSDSDARAALERPLALGGYTLLRETEQSVPGQYAQSVQAHAADVILAPPESGTALLRSHCRTPIIMVAEQASTRHVVDAIKLGAADFLVAPIAATELLASVERVLEEQRQPISARSSPFDSPIVGMIGRSRAMRTLYEQVHKVAAAETSVLIQGESGTGKELVARAVHAHSPRRGAALIAVNCAAIPATLIESELFGYERGALNGVDQARAGLIETADGGSLFLDEIGELPPEAQARLLQLLQHGELRRLGSVHTQRINVRLIAATHRDIRQMVAGGLFQEALFYLLNVVTLTAPPLRERRDDIVELVQYVLQRTCKRLNKPLPTITAAAMNAMLEYPWPGNVRELENAIERAVILCDGSEIPVELLALEHGHDVLLARAQEFGTAAAADATTLDDYFINFVLQHQEGMTETELATRLGISRKSLWERRQRFNVPRTRTPKRGIRNSSA